MTIEVLLKMSLLNQLCLGIKDCFGLEKCRSKAAYLAEVYSYRVSKLVS